MKMKQLSLILILIFFVNYVQAQKEIGITYAPNFSYSDSYPKFKRGKTLGFFYGYPLNERWSIETGIYYTQMNLEKDVKEESPFFIYYPSVSYFLQTESVSMVEVPLFFTFDWNKRKYKKIRPLVKIGYSGGYILKIEQVKVDKKTRLELKEELTLPGLIAFAHIANIGFELQYFLEKQMTLVVGGNWKVTNIYNPRFAPVYNFNLNLSIRYKWNTLPDS